MTAGEGGWWEQTRTPRSCGWDVAGGGPKAGPEKSVHSAIRATQRNCMFVSFPSDASTHFEPTPDGSKDGSPIKEHASAVPEAPSPSREGRLG
jgi:hypothetical protein